MYVCMLKKIMYIYKCICTLLQNLEFLKGNGITHIFNAAEGHGFAMVPPLDPNKLDGKLLDPIK
jgi:hypothetical protein